VAPLIDSSAGSGSLAIGEHVKLASLPFGEEGPQWPG
jgi:hypothetical protein